MAEGPGSPRHLPGVFEALVGAAIGAACSPGVIYCWRLISDSEPPKWAEDTLTNAVGAALVLGLIAFVGSLLRRRWHWTSKAAGDRLAIYVAFLEGDYSDDLRRSVIATIGKPLAAAGVEVLRAGTLLKEDSQGDALKATIKARKLLTRKGGHLLVWGRVLREAPRTVVELHFMSRADELEGDRFGLTEMLFIEPRLLSQMGGVIAGFAVVAARAASKDARAYAASESLSLAGGLKQLLGGRQEGFRQHDRTQICFAYGLLQSVIGDQTGDPDRLKEAAHGVRHGWLRHLAAVIEPQPEVSKMTIDTGLKAEGAPERSPIAGAGAPRASMQDRSAIPSNARWRWWRVCCVANRWMSSPGKRMSLWPS